MSDQKNIDNLFRETFNDFEASPDPALWDKISDKLDAQEAEKKRKGVVFLPWLYKGAGIAAAILLLFFLGNEFITTNGDVIDLDNQTTETTKEDSTTDENSSTDSNSSSDKIVTDTDRLANENDVDNTSVQKENTLQNEVVQQNGTNSNSQESSNSPLITNDNAVTNTNSSQRKNSIRKDNTKYPYSNNENYSVGNTNAVSNTNAVTQNSNNEIKNSTNSVQNGVNSSTKNTNGVENSNVSAVTQNDSNNSTNTSTTTETTETAVAEVKKDDLIKKSLLDVINELHDLEKDTEVVEAKRKKWTISPNASPIYYNSISNGSPIDETFADNTKAGDVNLSYGVNVGYDVSKRLTVRTGIHKVDYSYSTQDIALVPSINGNDLTTIAFRTDGNSFDIKDKEIPTNIVYSQYQLPSSESSIREKQIEGNLNQRMSYIEVPVELKYALLDKKLGINVIGGVSTLLLTENSILLDAPELVTEIGEATNVNDISFSTNIGVGIDYKVSNQIEFNVEPMLKYQLNTFSGNTGNFKPYSIGVYTGVSFRF